MTLNWGGARKKRKKKKNVVGSGSSGRRGGTHNCQFKKIQQTCFGELQNARRTDTSATQSRKGSYIGQKSLGNVGKKEGKQNRERARKGQNLRILEI